MMKINWEVRLKNKQFIIRTVLAIIIPILTYFKLQPQDITSWGIFVKVMVDFLSNPYLLILTAANVWLMIPDPISTGYGDTDKVLGLTVPK